MILFIAILSILSTEPKDQFIEINQMMDCNELLTVYQAYVAPEEVDDGGTWSIGSPDDIPSNSTLTNAELIGDNPCIDFDIYGCGKYYITYTIPSETCEGCIKSVRVPFRRCCEYDPIFEFPEVVCEDELYETEVTHETYNDYTYTYNWLLFDDAFILGNEDQSSVQWILDANQTECISFEPQVIITDSDGCEFEYIHPVVTIRPRPSVAVNDIYTEPPSCSSFARICFDMIGNVCTTNFDISLDGGTTTYGQIVYNTTNDPCILVEDGFYQLAISYPDAECWDDLEDIFIDFDYEPLVADVLGAAEYCDGSSSTLYAIVNGGDAPYTYEWFGTTTTEAFNIIDDPAPPLSDECITHTLQVTDANGCTNQVSQQVCVISVPDVTVSIIQPDCDNDQGSVCFDFLDNVSHDGIQFGLNGQVNWETPVDDSQVNQVCYDLDVGVYNFWSVWDDLLCPIDLGVYEIEEAEDCCPDPFTVSCIPTDGTCGDLAEIQTQTTGGSGSFIYLWSNGDITPNTTNLQGSTYVVTVTDQNTLCTSTCEATVEVVPPPIVVLECLDNQ